MDSEARTIDGNILTMSKSELLYTLCHFLLEVMNEKSDLYPHETLYSILICLQMYLHSKGVYYKFIQDPDFADVQNTLDNRIKHLSRLGLVTKKEKSQPFTMSEKEKMWSSGVLGVDNPEQLLNTLMYLLGVHLCLCAVEHKSLKVGYYSQIKVKFDNDKGCKFLQYTETWSKNHQGGTKDLNIHPKIVNAYANLENPASCVVSIYETYLSHRPSHDPKYSHDLYLHPLKRYTEHVWYSCQPLGINTLQQVTLKLAAYANLGGKYTITAWGQLDLHIFMNMVLMTNWSGSCKGIGRMLFWSISILLVSWNIM